MYCNDGSLCTFTPGVFKVLFEDEIPQECYGDNGIKSNFNHWVLSQSSEITHQEESCNDQSGWTATQTNVGIIDFELTCTSLNVLNGACPSGHNIAILVL